MSGPRAEPCLHGVYSFSRPLRLSLAGFTRPIVRPYYDWNIMQTTRQYLETRKSNLERNLLNAVDEETSIAIYKLLVEVDDKLFNLK